jgi:hypothetical protein
MSGSVWYRVTIVSAILLLLALSWNAGGCRRSQANLEEGSGESLQEEQSVDETQISQEGESEESQGGVRVLDLVLSPNPVEPASALTVKVILEGEPASVSVTLRGAGGSAEPVEYWRKTSTLSLKPGGPGEWVVGTVAPGQGGVYPVTVRADDATASEPGWLLKVYPRGFLAEPGSADAVGAVKSRFEKEFKGCELREVNERPLLEDDKRDPRFHKLFMVVFFKPFEGPVLPSGQISYFYYVVRDGLGGAWKVMQGGTGP